ncbi:hypothetical protein [Glaciibacter superstes]|uniref:hypothetical protein n=1 Tax=Glaciibacter superstes TaxID=501023 RepID=UPI0003B3009A|nr:hypothetical protein [Glaciibacter superstes]
MELMFVALGGAILGLGTRYILPGRSTQGSVLLPAIATAAASVFWVALTWLGLKWDEGWIWWISLGLAAIVAVVTKLLIVRTRARGDERMLHTLVKTGARAEAQTSA